MKKQRKVTTNAAEASAVVCELPHDHSWQDSAWRTDVRRRLLRWFDQNARVLPWRSEPTPYRVWVSEIMLQQTQVATVLPYFDRFIKRLPTVQTLAEIDEASLMRLWEGLGYYRRARSMHAAAKKIVAEHDGEFPRDFDSILALPGIGRYTAGAILSISQDQRYPILEGNTQRVFSRWIGLRTSPTVPEANRLLWQLAESMLPRSGSGRFNQAAMELGALVCSPKAPDCDHCPVMTACAAARLGLQQQIPGKLAKIVYESRTEFAFIVSRQTRRGRGARPAAKNVVTEYLVREVPAGRRWEGLWDFPRTSEQDLKTLGDAIEWLSISDQLCIEPSNRLMTLKHGVTKYRITLHVHAAKLDGDRDPSASGWRWASLDEIQGLALNATGRQIAQSLAHSDQSLLPL